MLLQNLYVNPQNSAKSADGSHLVANVSDEEMQEHYDNFFEDVFVECEDKVSPTNGNQLKLNTQYVLYLY